MKKLKFIIPVLFTLVLGACGPANETPSVDSNTSKEDVTTSDVPQTSEHSSETSTSEEEPKPEPLVPNTNPAQEPPVYEGDSIQFHYYRKNHDYDKWTMWLWGPGKDGAEYDFNGQDEYGAIAAYPLSNWDASITSLGFIIKKKGKDNWAKDFDGDRFVAFEKFEKDEKGIYHVYLMSGKGDMYVDSEQHISEEISICQFTGTKRIKVETNSRIKKATLYCNNEVLMPEGKITENKADFRLAENADFHNSYTVEITFKSGTVLTKPVSMNKLFGTKSFGDLFNYDGELGAIYTKEATTFKVWSPISDSITLRLYESGTPLSLKDHDATATDTPYKEVAMTKKDKGVFSIKMDGDLQGKYYTYFVKNSYFPEGKEVVDPYALSAGVNGVRGMIVDFNKTNPTGWEDVKVHQYDRKSLTVYETHVSDISSSKTWSQREEDKVNSKKFKGAYTEGTTYTKDGVTVSTGFDHIKELGVNAVQLVPVFDQANDEVNLEFNWGYNPLNYNVIEGGYSSNPFDGYTRIREFKELVQAYNKAGINIIMDVVYNHVAGAKGSNWDVLMPGYYYRYTTEGLLSNGSGCGNETASELFMMRKFMKDSTSFLAKEYKLGGFRFDLMGIHDVTTMNELNAELVKINPTICVYGEPWTGGEISLPGNQKPANQENGNFFEGYGQFNDQMRDAIIAGGMAGKTDKGWADSTEEAAGDINKLIGGIKGYTIGKNSIRNPNKTVNYVTCHDNYTLNDRFEAAGITDAATRKAMAMLSNSIVFTSQGTTFMLAGEEFLRTKGGDHNSYQSSYEVNELNYELKINNADMFENYKKLIEFKQEEAALHLNLAKDIDAAYKFENSEDKSVIKYELTYGDKTFIIMHRNGVNPTAEITYDLTGSTIKLATVEANKVASKATILKPFETIIAVK